MTVAHLQGKRSGRPRGSRSSSPLRRDLLWVARNLGKDRVPPSDGAKFWAEIARNEPEKFVAALAALDAARPRGDERQTGNLLAHAGRNLMKLFLPNIALMQVFRQHSRRFAPLDGKVGECVLVPARGGVLLTVSSSEFDPVPEGEPIPELQPMYAR